MQAAKKWESMVEDMKLKQKAAGLLAAAVLCTGGALAAEAAPIARRTAAAVLVDGVPAALTAYEIDGYNYFKLRDLAYVLQETPARFSVSFDGAAIALTRGEAYLPVGGELEAGTGADPISAHPSRAAVQVDGTDAALTAYEIGGYNYFKLRDLGEALAFGVAYDDAAQAIQITAAPVQDDAARVLDLMNAARAAEDLPALTLDDTLCEAAAIRAAEIAEKFDHTRPDGTAFYTVLKEVGIRGGYRTLGENIARGQTTPEAVMQDWMNSPGHRANILSDTFTRVGIARVDNGWVQCFWG